MKTLSLFVLVFCTGFFLVTLPANIHQFDETFADTVYHSNSTEKHFSNTSAINRNGVFSYGDAADNQFDNVKFHPGENAIFAVGQRKLSNGLAQATISKLDECGQAIWTKGYFSNTYEARYYDLEIMDDGHLLAVGFHRPEASSYSRKNGVISKIDVVSGAIIWSKTFTTVSRLWSITINKSVNDPDGESYYLFYSTIPGHNTGSSDRLRIIKLDQNGDIRWSKQYVSNSRDDETGKTQVMLPNGGFIVTGKVQVSGAKGMVATFDKDGNQQRGYYYRSGFAQTYFNAIERTADNGYLINGFILESQGRDHVYLKLDNDFNVESAFRSIDGAEISGGTVIRDVHGDLYQTRMASFGGKPYISILKFNKFGEFLFSIYAEVDSRFSITGRIDAIASAGILDEKIFIYDLSMNGSMGGDDAFLAVLDTSLESCVTKPAVFNYQREQFTRSTFQYTVSTVDVEFAPYTEVANYNYTQYDFCGASGFKEICNNGLDDDCDGLVDCEDPDLIDICCCKGSFYIDVSPGTELQINFGENIQLNASTNAVSPMFKWESSDDLSCVNCPNPIVKPKSTTTYILTVTDSSGCANTVEVTIFVDGSCDVDRHLFIPNIFSPNDDGVNDVFEPVSGESSIRITELMVFDRWGELLYREQSDQPRWDGHFKERELDPGVYIYMLSYQCADGTNGFKTGDVAITR